MRASIRCCSVRYPQRRLREWLHVHDSCAEDSAPCSISSLRSQLEILARNTAQLEEANVLPGTRLELELGTERYYAVAARTFADARSGEIILYEDAYRNVAIAISGGSAAEMFGAHEGQDLRIHLEAS